MSIQDIPKEVLERLTKLKNLEEGAKSVGSYAEAENAAARFQELLLKWNLSEESLQASSLENKLRMLNEEVDLSQFYGYRAANWAGDLLRAVAKHSMCHVVLTDKYKVAVLGEKQNVSLAIYFTEQLASKIEHAYRFSWTAYNGQEPQKLYRRGFLRGAVLAITSRLRSEEKKQTAAPENNGLALMIVSKREKAMDFLKEQFPDCVSRTITRGATGGADGYTKGVQAGQGMSLNKGLDQTNRRRLN